MFELENILQLWVMRPVHLISDLNLSKNKKKKKTTTTKKWDILWRFWEALGIWFGNVHGKVETKNYMYI